MRLSELQKNVRTLDLEFAGETLTFAYRPGEVTPAFSDALGTEKQPLVWALSKCMVSWDLKDDRDAPADTDEASLPVLPLTEQVLSNLATPFLRALLFCILDDVNVGEAFKATSKAG